MIKCLSIIKRKENTKYTSFTFLGSICIFPNPLYVRNIANEVFNEYFSCLCHEKKSIWEIPIFARTHFVRSYLDVQKRSANWHGNLLRLLFILDFFNVESSPCQQRFQVADFYPSFSQWENRIVFSLASLHRGKKSGNDDQRVISHSKVVDLQIAKSVLHSTVSIVHKHLLLQMVVFKSIVSDLHENQGINSLPALLLTHSAKQNICLRYFVTTVLSLPYMKYAVWCAKK